MSELALTLLRLGFLALLWIAVFATVGVLRRDLKAPREARPIAVTPSSPMPPPDQIPPKRGRRRKGRRLVITQGSLTGTALPLGEESILIGRAPHCSLPIDDEYASNEHARLYPSGDDWILEDLKSTNGTWINKRRITTPTPVPVGASIGIGRPPITADSL